MTKMAESMGMQLPSEEAPRVRPTRPRVQAVRLGIAAFVAGIAVVLSYEEMSFRGRIGEVLRTLPQRIAYGEAIELLAEMRQVLEAHPWALSRATASSIAAGLIEAERIAIHECARRNDFAEARKRLLVLQEFANERERAQLRNLRQRIERRAQVFANLEPWIEGRGAARAFRFESSDADQVREIYWRLSEEGKQGVRARFLELQSVSGIGAIADELVHGRLAEEQARDYAASLRNWLEAPRSVEWQRARDEGYRILVDAYMDGSGDSKSRARELMKSFVQLPEAVPATRKALLDLAAPPR